MSDASNIRHGRPGVFNLHVHLVLVTKYRRGVLTEDSLNELRRIFTDVCKDFESDLIEFNGEHDHVHLLVNDPPKVSVSK